MTVIVLIVLSGAVIVLLGALILVTVTFSRSLQKSLDNAERAHVRSIEQLQDVLDRLMARNIEDYKAYSLGDGAHGSIVVPERGRVSRPWSVPDVPEERSGQFLPRGGPDGQTTEVGRVADEEIDHEVG